jgi:hypothetical protein
MRAKIIHNLVVPFAICFLIALALYPDSTLDPQKYSTEGLELNYTVSNEIGMVEPIVEQKAEILFTPYLGKSFEGFKEALAFKESQGNYFTVNTYGYMGKYQFGKETLKMIGIYNSNLFLTSPELQEKAFIAYSQRNKWILRKDINRFVGKIIGGIKVTESGMLAAAHLAGAGSVKKFLRSYGQNNFADGFGTTVSYYMKRFSGYNTSFIEADRKAKARI